MFDRFKRFPLIYSISKSFTKKLITITLFGLLLGFVLSIAISNQGLIQLKNASVSGFKDQLDSNTQQVLNEYLNNTASNLEIQLNQVNREQYILNNIMQHQADISFKSSQKRIVFSDDYVYESLQSAKIQQQFPRFAESWEDAVHNKNSGLPHNSTIFMTPHTSASNDTMFSVKSAIWNVDRDEILGFISYNLSTKELVNKIEHIRISDNSFAFLSQSNGTLVAINNLGTKTLGLDDSTIMSSSPSKPITSMPKKFLDSRFNSVKNLSFQPSRKSEIQKIKIDNVNYWYMSTKLQPFKTWDAKFGIRDESWILGFFLPESDFSPPYENLSNAISNNTKEILLKQALIILLLFAFITSVVFLIYEKLTGNLTELIRATELIKKRNFDVSIELDTQDEFGILAQSFNNMTSEIKATVQQLTAQNELLKGEMDLKNRMDEQIAYMKQYDSLTGLPNKQSLYGRLEEYTVKAMSENKLGALVVIGLDNFKSVNEAYGMDVGDELLKAVAERLRTTVNADLVSRITGDEFGIVFYGLNVLDDLIARLDHLKYMMNEQFLVNELNLYMTASYGIASFPEDSAKPQELVKYATSALINAKENAKDHYRFYDSNIEQNIKNKVDLMNALRQCIEHNELKLVYQPITDMRQNKMVAVEALLRWQNSQFGYVPPNIFIPIAEEIKFVSELEKWVVQQVVTDMEIMDANGIHDLYISINLSALDLESDSFMDYLETTLKSNNVASGRIQLEITEGVLINRYDHIVPRLRQLSKNGVKIALDDFGTGYSSLKYIKRLPIDSIKIDRSFVKDYPDYDDGSIAKIIVNLATTLKLSVIAEGVETKQQAEFLSNVGCNLHQGYYYSKGISLSSLIGQIQESRSTHENTHRQ